jgi:hypothetical protein
VISTRIAGLITAGAVAAVLLAACGAAGGSTSDPDIPPPPSPDPYTSALIMTRTWAAAEIQTSVDSSIDGVVQQLRGVGEVAIDKGYADLTWTGAGSTFRELVNDRAIFTQSDGPSSIWVRTESEGRTATSAFADPLVNLTRVEGVSRDGNEDMNGYSAEKYRGTLPITAQNLEGLGLTDSEVSTIVDGADPVDVVLVRVWVDPNHRLVRIERSIDLRDGSTIEANVLASTRLSNFGVMLDLESPPSASVTVLQ